MNVELGEFVVNVLAGVLSVVLAGLRVGVDELVDDLSHSLLESSMSVVVVGRVVDLIRKTRRESAAVVLFRFDFREDGDEFAHQESTKSVGYQDKRNAISRLLGTISKPGERPTTKGDEEEEKKACDSRAQSKERSSSPRRS